MKKLIYYLTTLMKDPQHGEITNVNGIYSGFKPKPSVKPPVYPKEGRLSFNEMAQHVHKSLMLSLILGVVIFIHPGCKCTSEAEKPVSVVRDSVTGVIIIETYQWKEDRHR